MRNLEVSQCCATTGKAAGSHDQILSIDQPGDSRRKFLESLCFGIATTLATRAASAQDTPSRLNIRKAVKFHMVAEPLTVLDKFKLLKDIGFDGTEIRTGDYLQRNEFARASEKTGVLVHGIVNSADPNLSAAIDLAKHLGSDSVLIVAEETNTRSYSENCKHWQEQIRAVISQAEKNKVRLLIENVRATFLKTAEEMVRFIDSFDSPIVAAYFDTGNAITWTQQSAQHWANVLAHRIAKLDIKDRGHATFGDAKLRSETSIGTDGGEVHWQSVREQLASIDFSGWATAEVQGGDRRRLAGIAAWMDQVLRIKASA